MIEIVNEMSGKRKIAMEYEVSGRKPSRIILNSIFIQKGTKKDS